MKRVVSIRIEPKTLAGVYDFLEHVCSYDTSHLPVSTATQITMEAIVEWFRRKGELPLYATDDAALARLGRGGVYIPGAKLPDNIDRIAPIPQPRGKKLISINAYKQPHMQQPYRTNMDESGQVIEQNLNDNSLPQVPKQAIDPNVLKSKQEHMISLIDTFMAREEEDDFSNMLAVVKEENIYKEET